MAARKLISADFRINEPPVSCRQEAPFANAAVAWLAVAILLVLSFLERQIVSLMVAMIKAVFAGNGDDAHNKGANKRTVTCLQSRSCHSIVLSHRRGAVDKLSRHFQTENPAQVGNITANHRLHHGRQFIAQKKEML